MAEHEEHAAHGQSFYVRIWAILLALLAVSIIGPVVAPHVEEWLAVDGTAHVQAWMITLVTAFGIAIVKAYLVAANFMHLRIEKRYITYLLLTMLTLMLLFFAGVSPDVMRHKGVNWQNVAAQDEIGRALEEQKAEHEAGHGAEHH